MRAPNLSPNGDTGLTGERPVWLIPLLALAAVKLAVWSFLGTRYGFHRDELYYLIGGRHLELGYVDHPPLVPWLAAAVDSLFGPALAALRLLPALAGAAIVVLAGVLAARFGGGRRAQILAAGATLLCPFHLMAQNLFQTVPFDQLVWLTLAVLLTGLAQGRSARRTWLLFGAVAGLGLLTKYTLLAFGAAVFGALLSTSWRRELARPWVYLGGGLAFLVVAPNLAWQANHGWPTLEFLANNNAAERFPPFAFLGLTLVFVGPFALPQFLYGVWFWLSPAGRRFRLLGGATALTFVIFLLLESKPYYAAPLYPMVLAGGAVALERRLAALDAWRPAPAYLLLGNLLLLPVFLPILPQATYAELDDDFPHPEFGEMFGWRELVDTVGEAYHDLPDETRRQVALLASNYGSAAALDLWGGSWDLPAALSGHNSYYFWSRDATPDPAIAVGFRRDHLEGLYREVVPLGVIDNRLGIDNEEAGRAFYLVRGLRSDPAALWAELRVFR